MSQQHNLQGLNKGCVKKCPCPSHQGDGFWDRQCTCPHHYNVPCAGYVVVPPDPPAEVEEVP